MLAFALALSFFATDPELAALLDRLEAHEAKLARIYEDGAFSVQSTIESFGRGKKPSSTIDVETRVTNVKGIRREEIVKKLENGKDVTAEAIEKKKKDKQKKLESNPMILPFATKERPKYRFTWKKPDVITFEPVVAPADGVYRGEATVDPDKGEVLEVRARPTKLPAFVDEIAFRLELGLVTRAGPTPSALEVDGEGGVLFYRKRVRIRTGFSDYVVPE